MILYVWVKLRIKYRSLFVAKVLDFVSWHHNYFCQHLAMHRGNLEVSFHTIIHLWLANKKTSSNQRRANGVTAGTLKIGYKSLVLNSNAGYYLRLLDGVQAEITTLKCGMDNKLGTHFYYCLQVFVFQGKINWLLQLYFVPKHVDQFRFVPKTLHVYVLCKISLILHSV